MSPVGAAVICSDLQSSTAWWLWALQSSAVMCRHRRCGGFGSCSDLQSSVGIDTGGFGSCSHLQSCADIDSVVVLGAAVICIHLQSLTVWWFWALQSSAVICRHRPCGGFGSCSHLQSSAGFDSVVVLRGAIICSHLQASQNRGFCDSRQLHPVWGFKNIKARRGAWLA